MPKTHPPALTGSQHLTHGECMALIRAARKATKTAYAPYSRYRVGAAVFSRSGQMWTGANVENAAFPLGMCAERNALARAVAEGGGQFTGIAVATDGRVTPWPCGGCRQVIAELAPKADILVDTGGSTYVAMSVPELLPHPFVLKTARPAPAKPARRKSG